MKNNSTLAQDNFRTYLIQEVDDVQVVILSVMLAACLFGNILIGTTISKTRKLRTPSNLLIVNLSICDILMTGSAISFTLIMYMQHSSQSYPLGEIGCKVLWPFTTYASNCSIFTLATIAVDRYLNISSKNFKLTKRRTPAVLFLLHLIAILSVIPYGINLKYVSLDNGNLCYEDWHNDWQKQSYTATLFLVQYALPLIIMVICYSLAWRKIYNNNQAVIKMSEEYERKITSMGFTPMIARTSNENLAPDSTNCSEIITTLTENVNTQTTFDVITKLLRRGDSKGSAPRVYLGSPKCPRLMLAMQKEYALRTSRFWSSAEKREKKRFRKSPYSSQAAYFRSRQSTKILKMFTICVIVFGCFALPNQLYWLLQDFSYLPPIVSDIFISLTYVSSIINCWIYSAFDNRIRKAYIQTICCESYQRKLIKNGEYKSASMSPSLYDSRIEALFHLRKTSFNQMFELQNQKNVMNVPLYRLSGVISENNIADSIDSSTDESGDLS